MTNVEAALAAQRRVIQLLVPAWLIIGAVLVFLADAMFEKLFVLTFVPWISRPRIFGAMFPSIDICRGRGISTTRGTISLPLSRTPRSRRRRRDLVENAQPRSTP